MVYMGAFVSCRCVEVREQLCGVGSFHLYVDSQEQTQVARLAL